MVRQPSLNCLLRDLPPAAGCTIRARGPGKRATTQPREPAKPAARAGLAPNLLTNHRNDEHDTKQCQHKQASDATDSGTHSLHRVRRETDQRQSTQRVELILNTTEFPLSHISPSCLEPAWSWGHSSLLWWEGGRLLAAAARGRCRSLKHHGRQLPQVGNAPIHQETSRRRLPGLSLPCPRRIDGLWRMGKRNEDRESTTTPKAPRMGQSVTEWGSESVPKNPPSAVPNRSVVSFSHPPETDATVPLSRMCGTPSLV
jgi:hypothetical protein